ncbi:MAG TPA: hypothetical protein VGN06_01560 [Gaiellaceae bacterium]
MNLTVSRPIQIFALVAVIAAVGGMAMLVMKPKHAAAPPVVATKPVVTPKVATTVASKPVGSRATATPASTAKKGSVAATTAPTVIPPRKPVSVVGANGLPVMINSALKKHDIVIVSVFDPQSPTDAISYEEAKAGASDARVGFVGISLLDNPVAAALTSALPGGGLLPSPGVLIYRRPGKLVQRMDGFTDRGVVAEAAAASVTAAPLTGAGS